MRELSNEEKSEISFLGFIIPEFAEAYKMDKSEGYHYLKDYGGLDFILKCWKALHMENPRNVIRELFEICQKNGGYMR